MAGEPQWGILYVCPTPIGNLQDITLRVLNTLANVDVIACEDTRVSQKLLHHYQIKKPLFICEAHHLSSAKQKIVAFLKQGKKVALITDAGMPGIQDPGQEIISFLEKEGFSVDILPGPSAMIPAVVYSGFSTSGFVFIGFLPRLGRERKNLLEKTLSLPQSLVMYEAPTRILSTLHELICYCGEERQVVLCRELTKIHQEILRGSISDIIGFLSAREVIKGEIVLVLEGTVKREKGLSKEMKKMVRFLREKKLSQKDIVESLSEIFSLKKNQLKDYL